jgi:hypothetical protein
MIKGTLHITAWSAELFQQFYLLLNSSKKNFKQVSNKILVRTKTDGKTA